MPGIRVYFVNDQVGILDRHHTRIDFDAVMYDTNNEWRGAGAPVPFTWRPAITVPTLVRLDAHVSWTPPVSFGGPVGYAKIWSHWQRELPGGGTDPTFNIQLGEGRRDGPLSPANPGINYSDQLRIEPGWFVHMVFMGFSNANGHRIQSGSDDAPDGTPARSYFAASY